MRVPLTAVADDGDLLGLDQIDVRITIVIDAHDCSSPKCVSLHVTVRGRLAGREPNSAPGTLAGDHRNSNQFRNKGANFLKHVIRNPAGWPKPARLAVKRA